MKLRERFDQRRQGVQRDYDYAKADRDQHVRNGNQMESRHNKGVYAYVNAIGISM